MLGGGGGAAFRDALRQTVALVGVEDGEALEEGNGRGVFAGFCGTPALVGQSERSA